MIHLSAVYLGVVKSRVCWIYNPGGGVAHLENVYPWWSKTNAFVVAFLTSQNVHLTHYTNPVYYIGYFPEDHEL